MEEVIVECFGKVDCFECIEFVFDLLKMRSVKILRCLVCVCYFGEKDFGDFFLL